MHILTVDEIKALDAFAAQHKRTWRDTLTQVYWYNARIWRDLDGSDLHGTTLHRLRNTAGGYEAVQHYWPDCYPVTQKALSAAVQALGLLIKKDAADDYRVTYPIIGPLPGGHGRIARLRNSQEAVAYYTTDRHDALLTAIDMARRPNPVHD